MAINAVLAIIVDDGGQAIVVIYTEGEETNYLLLYFIDSDKSLRQRPHSTPCEEAPGDGVCSSIKPWPWRGKRLHHGGDVCELCVLGVLLAKSLRHPPPSKAHLRLFGGEKKSRNKTFNDHISTI